MFFLLSLLAEPSHAQTRPEASPLPLQIDYSLWASGTVHLDSLDCRLAHVPKGFLPEVEPIRPRIALALSGGGARGLAHIGVLQVLQRDGIPVDIIVGTSMGAVVGALYSVGYNAGELEGITTGLDWGALFSDAPSRRNLFLAQKETANQEVLNLRFRKGRPYIPDALVTGEKLFLELFRLVRNAPYSPMGGPFDNTRVVYGAVATDLNVGKKIVFREGDLPLALRGSMAVPIVFRPLRYNGRLIVDGGSVENIPSETARDLGGDLVIAVDCATPSTPDLDPDLPWEIANQVTTLMTSVSDSVSRQNADLAIMPHLDGFSNTDFQHAGEIIEAGREAAREQLPRLHELLGAPDRKADLLVGVRRVVLDTDVPPKQPLNPDAFGLVPGRLSTAKINRALTAILRDLRRQGYGGATLRAEIEKEGVLRIRVDMGIVRTIRVEGAPKGHVPIVLRDVRVPRGEPLHTQDVVKSLVQMHATGRYTTVYSSIRPQAGGGVILSFIVEESPLPRLGLGLGFDTDRRSRYLGELAVPSPIPDLGNELVLRARYGERDRLYGLYTNADRLSRTYIGWQANFEYSEREETVFGPLGNKLREANVWTTRGQAAALFNMKTWGRVSAGTFAESDNDNLGASSRERIYNGFLLRATLDTEDRRPFPRSGSLIDASYSSYISPIDDRQNFNLIRFHAEGIAQVYPRIVLRSAFYSNVAEQSTPSTHRFSIGGLQSFPALAPYRFLALRQVGGTLETRYDLISKVIADAYVLFRYDVSAFSDQKDWHPTRRDLIQSYALGLALDTVLGPFELWGAYSPVSHTGPAETRVAVNFGYHF